MGAGAGETETVMTGAVVLLTPDQLRELVAEAAELAAEEMPA
jgi:hypothetical protein